jgi:hypothetical protein
MKNKQRIRADNRLLHGYAIRDSSNVTYVGWQDDALIVWFKSGGLYRYEGVSRQRAVACALSKSVGGYINRVIRPRFEAVRLA